MFDRIAPRYELCNRLFTFGLDGIWRREALSALGAIDGARVLDLACGTGDLSRMVAARGGWPIGVDLSARMLALGGDHPRLQADAAALPFADGSFDAAISGFALRNFTDLAAVFSELSRVLAPEAPIALLDVSTPESPLVRLGHRIWFNHAVPFLGGLISDRAAYSYLPASVAYLPPPAQLEALLAQAGFCDLRSRRLSGGITQLITARRRGG